MRFGRDTNLWSHGRRSVVLSDEVATYDQVQIRTTFWRVQYMNLFASPSAFDARTATGFQPRKYITSHRLALKVTDFAEVGVFETVVFATDSLDTRSRFDLAYANPIIFLRAAERDRGSPDNAMLGIDGRVRLAPGLSLYGQFLLDELIADNIGEAHWANKWAWQLGAHVVNLPTPRTDLRVEFARMRPFLYSHKRTINSYAHFGDNLGHPAGPNAWNLLVEASYIVTPRVTIEAAADVTAKGLNVSGENMGADPLLSYNTRRREFGHDFLQGNLRNGVDLAGAVSYELLPTLNVRAQLIYSSTTWEEGAPGAAPSAQDTERYLAPIIGLSWSSPGSILPGK